MPLRSCSPPFVGSRAALPLLLALLFATDARTQATAAGEAAAATAIPPFAAFVYLEPFEIRLEFVARLTAVLRTADDVLEQAELAAAVESAEEVLRAACEVRADDVVIEWQPVEAGAIRIDPAHGPMPDERTSIPTAEAVVGVVLRADRSGFPTTVACRFEWFPIGPGANRPIPLVFEAQTQTASHSESLQLTPAVPSGSWILPPAVTAPRLVAVSEVRAPERTTPIIVGAGFGLLGIGVIALGRRRPRARRIGYLVAGGLALVLGGGAVYRGANASAAADVSETEARGIVEALLGNVYHAFAYRDESTIFDTLASSVDGPLLEQLYLDIRRGLDVEESGGPRVKVLKVTIVSCELQRAESGALQAGVVWVSEGNVNHWGHEHHRRNQYRGELTIAPHDGRWKLEDVEILSEERT